MNEKSSPAHWNNVYVSKGDADVSWFEHTPAISLELVRQHGDVATSSLVDIGGGASRLVDSLLAGGMREITVLDLSSAALDVARARLGPFAAGVEWVAENVARWKPARQYDFWHDRAAFHFLTAPVDRAAYVERLHAAVKPGGHAIIATFALDGPERCSGLPVERYDPQMLAEVVGPGFQLVAERRHIHTTPWGSSQSFQFSVLRRTV